MLPVVQAAGMASLPLKCVVFVFPENTLQDNILTSNTAACFQDCWRGAYPHFTVPVPENLIF